MPSIYDTARSEVPDHVDRIIRSFFEDLLETDTTRLSDETKAILYDSEDTMVPDLDEAITKALKTEISKWEQRGKPVRDMSELQFSSISITAVAVDDALMVGSIEGKGWSGNGETFNVPLEYTRARDRREAKDREEVENN
ncbi:hypothetical protein I350_06609 [Cryptococcus amylolentus CBS 6273]|uniref:Uncharacterized protein n=1 Tax=Cryptococcus amylolentus CBS 6273 TaxID=1296118 RepID=A0A1E3JLQ5_9TREE|nr:hypothetical protein I350_06609 [Cryptococcus amylolentus CBS 6273]